MRTEEILKRMERQTRQRKWRRMRRRLLRELLRGGICLLGGAAIIGVGVPVMEIMMGNLGARFWMEAAVCYFGILWMVAKVYGLETNEK